MSYWQTPDIKDVKKTTVFEYNGDVEDITIISDIPEYNESVLETNNNFANSSLKSVYLGRDIFGTFENNINLNSDFYLCGPPPFMKAVEGILLDLGVDSSKINYELFSN